MAFVHVPSKDSFGKRFGNAFNTSLNKSLDRYSEEESENRKLKAKSLIETAKQEKEIERNRRNAKALLGREDLDLDSSAIASIYKEQEKNARNDELMKFLGIGSSETNEESGGNVLQSLGNKPAASPMNMQQPQQVAPTKGRFNLLEVPDQAIAAISLRNPALANVIQQSKKQALDERVRQEEVATKSRERSEDIERKPLEKATENYFSKVAETRDRIPALRLSVDAMKDAVKRGDVGFFSSAHIAEIAASFGVPETVVAGLQTPGSKEFNAARKTFLGSILKDLFKGTTTKGEIGLAESILAEIGVTTEANQAALFLTEADLMIKEEEDRLFDEAREQRISNYKIQDYVNKNLKPYREELTKEFLEAVNVLSKKK